MKPHSLRSRIIARVLWLGAGVGLGAHELIQGNASHFRAQSLLGLGLVLLGIMWFLQPPNLFGQVGRVDALAQASAVGPAGLRLLLTLAALVCMLAALYFLAVSRGLLAGPA